jgi:hypothetical protein
MNAPAFRRRPDVLWRRSLDAVVLLPVAADDVVTVAGTGIDIWNLLDTWRTVDSLVHMLSAEYGADPTVVHADVTALLTSLEELGALETTVDSGGTATG